MYSRSYSKIDQSALSRLYNRMCCNIPIYEVMNDCRYNQPLFREDEGNISAAYYKYRRVIEIGYRISIIYDGHEIIKNSSKLFHKLVRPYRRNKELRRGYIITHIIIKRMYPLLGKVKQVNFEG